MNVPVASGQHWSFWLIGGVALIFNLLGCINLVAQLDTDALAAMPEAYRFAIESRPLWATGTFAIAVFGGGLGCVLLLLKQKIAWLVFIAALAAAIVTVVQFHSVVGINPVSMTIGSGMQVAVAAFLVWYSKHAQARGWIR